MGETPTGGFAPRSLPAVRPAPVRPFRFAKTRRLVAALLVAAFGVSLAPPAVAQPGSRLEAVLDDVEAFEAALDAARASSGDPAVAFAESYAAAVGDVSPDVILRLLDGSSMSAVPPPARDAVASASKLAGPTAPAAGLPATAGPATVAGLEAPAEPASALRPPLRRLAPSARPRAP